MVPHSYNTTTQDAEAGDCHKFKFRLGYSKTMFQSNYQIGLLLYLPYRVPNSYTSKKEVI